MNWAGPLVTRKNTDPGVRFLYGTPQLSKRTCRRQQLYDVSASMTLVGRSSNGAKVLAGSIGVQKSQDVDA